MNQIPDARKIPDDEIDIKAIGYRMQRIVFYPFRLLANNIWTTLSFIVAAVLLAVALKYILPKTYKSSFIIRPNDKGEKFHLWVMNDIQRLLKEDDIAAVSRELQIDETTASQIVRLDLFNPFIKNRRDSINYTEISIITLDPQYIIPVQNALLNYLENIPYFNKIKTLQKSQVKMNLEQVNKDLKQLDSLKKLQIASYGSQLNATGPVYLNQLINPTATYSMTAERMNKKTALLSQEIFFDNFQLIKSCVVGKHHDFPPRILVMCLILIPLFLVLCCIFLHLRNHRRINT